MKPAAAPAPTNSASASPARRYSRFLPVLAGKEILDFGLKETELRRSARIARWLGVRDCFLKLEITHPTRTVKDRITEIAFSFFQAHGVQKYVHCSAGNAGTSLVWGAGVFQRPFEFESFIPEAQLPYHNFNKLPGLTTVMLEGAEYEEAKRYCSRYAADILGQPEYMSFRSNLRRQANKIPYLEAFEQLWREKGEIDAVCQAVSDGGGIVGAELAASNAVAEGWLPRRPAFVIAQPSAANPVVRCFRKGLAAYDPSCTLPSLRPSRAFAIRRKDASGYYADLHGIISQGGGAFDATEREISAARGALRDLEKVDAGYTACTILAALRKENQAAGAFARKSVLVMITGADRPTSPVPRIDRVVRRAEWRRAIARA